MTALPIDYDAVRTALVGAVTAALGLAPGAVIVAEPEVPNSPRPALPYMTLKFVSPSMRFGIDEASYDASTSSYVSRGPRAMLVSFNCYGQSHEQAYGLMALWQALLDVPPTQQSLALAGLSVQRVQPIRDLTALLTTGYEGRSQMDVQFGLAMNLSLPLFSISSVAIAGTVTQNTIADISITPSVGT